MNQISAVSAENWNREKFLGIEIFLAHTKKPMMNLQQKPLKNSVWKIIVNYIRLRSWRRIQCENNRIVLEAYILGLDIYLSVVL